MVVDKQAIRLSHPDHDRIGKPFIGEDILPTLRDGTEYSNVALLLKSMELNQEATI
ncbi:hypothetical protein [Vibrio cincinnatiensis]|uniref:hypothetical protein n=1 Tax=Vibrio cincinnatiensis TaxID=675 RepID=UPI001EDCFF53